MWGLAFFNASAAPAEVQQRQSHLHEAMFLSARRIWLFYTQHCFHMLISAELAGAVPDPFGAISGGKNNAPQARR